MPAEANPFDRAMFMADYLRAKWDAELGVEGLQRLYIEDEIDLEAFEDRVARILEADH